MASIIQHTNALADKSDGKEMRKLFESVLADVAALRAAQAQLIVDYNANATIATDTTAIAPVLKTTA